MYVLSDDEIYILDDFVQQGDTPNNVLEVGNKKFYVDTVGRIDPNHPHTKEILQALEVHLQKKPKEPIIYEENPEDFVI